MYQSDVSVARAFRLCLHKSCCYETTNENKALQLENRLVLSEQGLVKPIRHACVVEWVVLEMEKGMVEMSRQCQYIAFVYF